MTGALVLLLLAGFALSRVPAGNWQSVREDLAAARSGAAVLLVLLGVAFALYIPVHFIVKYW